jgi:predicted RNA methylase
MSKKAHQERSRELDQFYTDPKYAEHFYNKIKEVIDISAADILLEPSAGTGSFYNLLDVNKRIGLDLEPKAVGVIQQDFFWWNVPKDKSIITLGNPPFGKNSNLAIQFFNRAAIFSDAIAFVLPRTFKKDSVINRLDKNFHLIYEEIVPENSFIFNGNPYSVWCCAQVWVKKDVVRPKIQTFSIKDVSEWFTITEPDDADFSIQRVGGKAGTIRTEEFKSYSRQSHYFFKQHDSRVLEIFKGIDFDEVRYNTAGNPSVSPSELVKLWIKNAKLAGIIKDAA